MSVNVSLSDTPGVSAYFDGQPIQDEMDEEVRREEERQEKELRDLLASELEDFEDDFLSESNSDEDSMNVSQASTHRSRNVKDHKDKKSADADYDRVFRDSSNNVPGAFHSPAVVQQMSTPAADDDWMMRVQSTSGTTPSPYNNPYAFHHHNFNPFPNAEAYHQTDAGDHLSMPHAHDHSGGGRVPINSHQDINRNPRHYQMPEHFVPHQNMDVTKTATESVLQDCVSKSIPPPLPSSTPPSAPSRVNTSKEIPQNLSVSDDVYPGYQIQYKATAKQGDNPESYFYLGDGHADFFLKEGTEERRTYDQLEILYRARGRELEDIQWKLEKQEEENAKEVRILKHKLAVSSGEAEGAQESLKQCQILLQKSKSDLSDSSGRIRALEAQSSSLTDVKEELIKKLQIGESTIENLSHQVQELQDTESLSRARNEHDAVISSLSQRYEREILSLKEKLDETSTDLATKTDEYCWLKKQLSDTSKELEQAQISRGETINRLTKSLEDSQRQCQSLLERASGQEVASLRVQLQQTMASKTVSEDMCASFQAELKELKEQLNMFESASVLGAVTTAVGASTHSGPSLDDSMTDLGIKKALDFGTPHSTSNVEGTSSSDDLISSLRSELERCLRSNKQKRQEVVERKEETKSLKTELQTAKDKLQELERTCSNQKSRLDKVDSLMSSDNNVGIVEAKFKRDIENLKREQSLLLEDLEDHKKRLEELGASEARVMEINTELSQQIAQMVKDFDTDKRAALERSHRTLEDVHQMTLNNLRSDLESQFESEKAMMTTSYDNELDILRKQLMTSEMEIDKVKNLYIKTCEEKSLGEQEMRDKIQADLNHEIKEIERKHLLSEDELETERNDWAAKKNDYEIQIRDLENKVIELKTAYENDKEKLQQLLNSQMVQANEEWKAKMDALTETLSEEKKEKERVIKERQLLQEEMQSVELNNTTVEDQSVMTGNVASQIVSFVDIAVQTALEMSETCGSDGQDPVKDVNDNESCVSDLKYEMENLKIKHALEIEGLRNEHRKEFENAARKREEKFQTELRYFLKEKEEKAREKLEMIVRDQKEKSNVELEEKLNKIETEHKLELQQLKSQLEEAQKSYCSIQTAPRHVEDDTYTHSLIQSSQMKEKELERLKDEFSKESRSLELKIEEVTKQKNDEINKLICKHEHELIELQEQFNNEIGKLKLEIDRNMCQNDRNGNENQGNTEDSNKVMESRLQEERAKWFREAHIYISNEIENGVKQHTEELQQKLEANSSLPRRQEEEVEEEIKSRVQKFVEEEKKKVKVIEESRELEREMNLEGRVKVKVQTEVDNLKAKFLSELNARVAKEKNRLEEDLKQWKDNTKKKIEEEKEKFAQSMILDMERKLDNDKQNIMQKKEEEIKNIKQEMEEEMNKKLQTEREKLKEENERNKVEAGNYEKVGDLKERLQSEVKARTKACAERDKAVHFLTQREKLFNDEKQKLLSGLKECRDNLNGMKKEHVALEEKCSQMERRYKDDMREAKKKKEAALLQLSLKFNEEKESLVQSFKSHITAMNDEFTTELEKVRNDCEMEKASALLEVRSHAERALTISPMQEPDMEATTLFELRDHYLETVKKIKDDVMNHVQAANTRAASTLRMEMRKQKVKLIKVFQEKCKASIRAILFQQVPATCINSIEHSIDIISESLVTTPTTPGRSKSPVPTSHSNNGLTTFTPTAIGIDDAKNQEEPSNRWKPRDRAEHKKHRNTRRSREVEAGPSQGSTPESCHNQKKEKVTIRQRMKPVLHRPGHYHPQLSKVDLSDNDSAAQSPGNSNQSSPNSIRPNQAATRKVPPLDLSAVDETLPENPDNLKQGEHFYSEGNVRSLWKSYPTDVPHQEEDRSPCLKEEMGNYSPLDIGGKQHSSGPLHSDKSNFAYEEVSASPRERLKMIEARVRLANWASSGEMPWKSLDEEEERTKKLPQRSEISSPVYSVSSQTQEPFSSQQIRPTHLNWEREDNEDKKFIRPGKEAVDFLTSRKKFDRNKYGEDAMVKLKRDGQNGSLDGYFTDDSSNESHTSLVTLEPDLLQSELEDKHPNTLLRKGRVTLDDDNRLNSRMDYDRIKAAVWNKEPGKLSSHSAPPVTGAQLRKMGFDSDSETDSSSTHSQNYMSLPTSTPPKKFPEKLGRSKSKSKPNAGNRNQRVDRSGNSEYPPEKPTHSLSDDWKPIHKVVDSGNGNSGHREFTNSTRRKLDTMPSSSSKQRGSHQRTKSVERPTHGDNRAVRTPEVAFDRSSITWASDDHYDGGGMWRYRSLEDILASLNGSDAAKDSATIHSSDKTPGDLINEEGLDYHRRNKMRSVDSKRHQKSDPIQAMDSDFWAQHSTEDGYEAGEFDDVAIRRLNIRKIHSDSNSYPNVFRQTQEGVRRKVSADEVKERDKPSYWTPNKRKDPPQQPAFSSEPRYTTSSSRYKASENQIRSPTAISPESSCSALPRSFATHVKDVRKSLEAMENTPFAQTLLGKKSKMKRSTSEQSLHLLRWDQDSSLASTFDRYQPGADIDDLISVYTKAPVSQSQFDLHNFGTDALF